MLMPAEGGGIKPKSGGLTRVLLNPFLVSHDRSQGASALSDVSVSGGYSSTASPDGVGDRKKGRKEGGKKTKERKIKEERGRQVR